MISRFQYLSLSLSLQIINGVWLLKFALVYKIIVHLRFLHHMSSSLAYQLRCKLPFANVIILIIKAEFYDTPAYHDRASFKHIVKHLCSQYCHTFVLMNDAHEIPSMSTLPRWFIMFDCIYMLFCNRRNATAYH